MRCTCLIGLIAFFVSAVPVFAQDNIVLENKTLRLEFSKDNGALVKMSAVESGWKILDRPELGLSFRLLVPLDDKQRDNPVFGEKQKATSITVGDDHKSLKLVYDGVTSEHGGKLDIKVTLTVNITERQAEFGGEIVNHSKYTVENVYWPYLGDVQHPEKAKWLKTLTIGYGNVSESSIWPTFPNGRGYWGVDYPTQFSACMPMTPFFLVHSEAEGLYFGVNDRSYEVISFNTEFRPGVIDIMDNQVPQEPNYSGKECATRLGAVHVPFILPGESHPIAPIVLEAFKGDWTAGADIYKNWRNTWMKIPSEPNWAKEPHSWIQVHINSPEDELRVQYKDLVKIGEDCAKHGVKAIQLVGWNLGGQDRGNPSHSTDSRLGTPKELAESIKKIQAMGVKVILFSKFTWADRSTDWFKHDLIKQAIKDPYGDYYQHGGYQYQTATQLLDINTRRLIPMCFLSQAYLDICNNEFKKILSYGPDGILFDECQHHNNCLLCFDKTHGHRYGAPVYKNDCKLIENFNALVKPTKKEFLFAGEGPYDWEFQVYNLSYIRSNTRGHTPAARYLLPYASIMTGVWGFNDRNIINQCLMYRYIISYEPYNFKGKLDDIPMTVAYGQKMDALRTELRDYFWDGEFRYEKGAKVTADGWIFHPPYSVFENKKNGKLGVVVVNYDDKPATVKVQLEKGDYLKRYRLVDNPQWSPIEKGIIIPAKSAAVVIE